MSNTDPSIQVFKAADPAVARRAFVAFIKSEPRAGLDGYTPDHGLTCNLQIGKHTYVCLRWSGGALALYRIMNRGELKRLKRWPPGDIMGAVGEFDANKKRSLAAEAEICRRSAEDLNRGKAAA